VEAASRIALKLFGVDLPDDKEACHTCDNPLCVNPRHLFVGSHYENMVDATVKNRLRKRLTPEIVRNLRELSAVMRLSELQQHFRLSQTTVSAILRYETWRHVNHPTSQVA
jgi:hypothetical protein